MILPRPRIRVRPAAPPIPRARVRQEPDPPPPRAWNRADTVSVNMPREEVCRIGEVDITVRPDRWAGWPNGSLVIGLNGAHKGRHIRTTSGSYHVLLWNRARGAYIYLRLAKTHAEALSAL